MKHTLFIIIILFASLFSIQSEAQSLHKKSDFLPQITPTERELAGGELPFLLAPAACIHVDAVNNIFFDAPASYEDLADSAFYWGRWFGKDYFRAAREIKVFERTGAYDGPVLIVQGDADMPNLLRDSRLYPNYIKDCKYVELPGLTHCFVENYALPASLSLEFIQQNL